MDVNWTEIEAKWRKKWNEGKDFEANPNDKEKKFITVAYPYPNSPSTNYWITIHGSMPVFYKK